MHTLGRLYKVSCSASPPSLDVQDFIAVCTTQLCTKVVFFCAAGEHFEMWSAFIDFTHTKYVFWKGFYHLKSQKVTSMVRILKLYKRQWSIHRFYGGRSHFITRVTRLQNSGWDTWSLTVKNSTLGKIRWVWQKNRAPRWPSRSCAMKLSLSGFGEEMY